MDVCKRSARIFGRYHTRDKNVSKVMNTEQIIVHEIMTKQLIWYGHEAVWERNKFGYSKKKMKVTSKIMKRWHTKWKYKMRFAWRPLFRQTRVSIRCCRAHIRTEKVIYINAFVWADNLVPGVYISFRFSSQLIILYWNVCSLYFLLLFNIIISPKRNA